MNFSEWAIGRDSPVWIRYLIAIGIFAAALSIRLLILPAHARTAYMTFYPGIAIVAVICGIGPSLLYILISAVVGGYIFLPPHWRFDKSSIDLVFDYSVAATIIFLTIELFRRQVAQQSRKLEDIVAFLPDAALAYDAEKRIIIWNKAIEKMTGVPAAEMLGRGDHACTIPFYGEARAHLADLVFLDSSEIAARYPTIKQEGDSITAEVFCNALYNNKGAWVFAKASPLHDYSGKVIGAIEIVRDITERKQAEAQTHTQLRLLELGQAGSKEELLQAALDAAEEVTGSQIGFFHFVDDDQENLTLQAWSTNTLKNMCTAEGKGQHYAISKAGVWVDCVRARAPVIHNDYASLAHKRGMPEGHAKVTRELVIPIIREGKVTEIMGVGNKATDYDQKDIGAVQLIASMVQDILGRWRAEETLRTSEERYRTVAEFTHDWEYWILPDGSLPYVSPSCEKISGYQAEEFQQDPALLTKIVHPDDRERLKAHLRAVKAPDTDQEHHELEFRIFTRHGEERWLGHVCQRVYDGSGKHLGRRASNRDITRRKLAEQELKRSHQELRTLSIAASEAIEDERRRTARELHDELGQLLTVLKLDMQSCRSHMPPNMPEQERRIQEMLAMLDVMVAATRRIAANLRPMLLDDLGLGPAIESLTENFSEQTGIAIELVIDDSLAQVPEPTASALYRITQESLTNVTKYAEATTVEINLERAGDWIQLTIRDNGRGIKESDQNKPGHFGLLGIRERVMLLSGEFTIMGKPGRGTELRVCIPLPHVEAL